MQEIITEVGCNVPYGYKIDNVCKDKHHANEAMLLRHKLIKETFLIKTCLYPCRFTRTYFRDRAKLEQGNPNPSSLFLKFSKFIKTSKARYAYQELELIAEFGGYVGLFLGISVFHLRQAFEKIVEMTFRHLEYY